MFKPYNDTIPPIFAATEDRINSYAGNILNSVTGLVCVTRKNGETVNGSCFFFSNTYNVITCAHVLDDYRSFTVQFEAHGKDYLAATERQYC